MSPINKDFHYYATYVAARIAGHNSYISQIIAYAAQYVDDYSKTGVDLGCLPNLVPTPTVQTFEEILDTSISEEKMINSYKIWAAFHFLPGNLDSNSKKIIYQGEINSIDASSTYKWNFDEESKEQFKLLCLPNSLLVSQMINDYRDHTNYYLIGIRMHVLADTWSHSYFSGIPAWFINDIVDDVKDKYLGKKLKYPYDEFYMPRLPSFNSNSYLGHIRLGNLPDLPYMHFSYIPQWNSKNSNNKRIIKNNPEIFLTAFRQMCTAMRRIITKKYFDPNAPLDNIDDNVLNVVSKILHTRINDQTNEWKKHMSEIKVNNVGLEVPIDYDKNFWLFKARNTSDQDKYITDYYQFNQSVNYHLNQFEHYMNNGILLTKESSSFITTLGTNKNMYISKSNHIHPTLGDKPILLYIIKPNSDMIKSGDIVKIKTSEFIEDKKTYLGVWPDYSNALYYYTKDYNISKQKWRIIKAGGILGDRINPHDSIFLENIHYEQEYINNYIAKDFKTYLNTTKSTPKDWIINFTKNNSKISAAYRYSIALKIDGTLEAWGDNYYKQLDILKTNNVYTDIYTGGTFFIGIKTDGTFITSGDNKYGQLKIPSEIINNISYISTGWNHSIALTKDSFFLAWGDNRYKKCPVINDDTYKYLYGRVRAVSAGKNHTLVLLKDGSTHAWGDNSFGQCYVSDTYFSFSVSAIAAGWNHSLLLKKDGTIVAVGDNKQGQCTIPVGLSNVIAISAGREHSIALKNDGTVIAWGSNTLGQCNIPKEQNNNIIQIAAGADHSIALKNDGTIIAWGDNEYDQCKIPPNLNILL